MDAISDIIIRIKNANAAGKESVSIPHSKAKEAVAKILEKEGYVASVTKKGKKFDATLEIGLISDEYGPRVKGVERVSKLSKRVYAGAKDIRPVKQGHGILVITTPKGLKTDAEARKEGIGGELLFKVW